MTLADLNQKTDDELCVMLAELQGWKRPEHPDAMKFKVGWSMPEKWWMDPKGVLRFGHDIPRYTASLDACAPVIKSLPDALKFASALAQVMGCAWYQSNKLLLAEPDEITKALILTLTQP